MFAIHSRQCSTLFSHSLDSMFLLGCNSITSYVLWQLASSLQRFPEMYKQGVLGQLKFTCSNSNQIPGECASYCIRPSFKEISCVVMKHLKQRAFFLFSEQLCVETQIRVVVHFQMLKLYVCAYLHAVFMSSSVQNAKILCSILTRRYYTQNCRSMWTMTAVWMPEWGQESHSSEGFNIAEVVLTPCWETIN